MVDISQTHRHKEATRTRGEGWTVGKDEITKKHAEMFQPQVFLMKNWRYFVAQSLVRDTTYKYFMPIYGGNPFEINNRLLGSDKISNYMHTKRSHLTEYFIPTLKIYKVYTNGYEVPFNITWAKNHAQLLKSNKKATILQQSKAIGQYQSSFMNFSWERAGNTTAEWRASIIASMKFMVSHPDVLNSEFYGNKINGAIDKDGNPLSVEEIKEQGYGSKLLDLITRPPTSIPNPKWNYEKSDVEKISLPNPHYYRIKVVVGWKVKDGEYQNRPPSGKKDLYERIARDQTDTLFLSCEEHNIDFEVNGGFINKSQRPMNISVNYKGMMSNVLSQAGVFQPTEKSAFNPYGGVMTFSDDGTELSDQHHNIINKLLINNKIYYHKIKKKMDVVVGYDNITRKEKTAAQFVLADNDTIGNETIMSDLQAAASVMKEGKKTEELIQSLQELRTGTEGSIFNLQWFYLGDLIDVVLGQVYENKAMKDTMIKMRFLLGTVVVKEASENYSYCVNISDFPISMETFTIWFQDKILNSKIKHLTVSSFFDSIFNSLIKGVYGPLTEISREVTIPQISFNTFSLPIPASGDPLFGALVPGDKGYGKKRNISDDIFNIRSSAISDMPHNHYFLVNSFDSPFSIGRQKSSFDQEDYDAKHGIPHIKHYRNFGPVEGISFSKVDNPALVNVNLRRAVGASANTGILKNIYNANIKMLGSPIFKPGTVLYIDPEGLGLGNFEIPHSLANELTIGGYFIVMKSSHNKTFFQFKTELECQFYGIGSKDIHTIIHFDKDDAKKSKYVKMSARMN